MAALGHIIAAFGGLNGSRAQAFNQSQDLRDI